MRWAVLPVVVLSVIVVLRQPPAASVPNSAPLASPAKYAGAKYSYDPLDSELLEYHIDLPDCPGVQIIEWRPSPGREEFTRNSPRNIQAINDACKLAVESFPRFAKKEKLPINEKTESFSQFICLMPFSGREGLLPRNLNDTKFRFSNRPAEEVWGWTGYKNQTIYLRNDVSNHSGINRQFLTVFLHEMYHAQAWYYGIRDLKSSQEDEKLAEKFTAYLGY